jgi:Flp pilus assembly protein TadD
MIVFHRPGLLLGALLSGILALPIQAIAIAGSPAFRAPFTPEHDDELLQLVPSTTDPAVAALFDLRARLATSKQDLALALQLADAYVDYGRQVGDAHYAGYAEAVIAPWLARSSSPARVLVTQATILQYRHQFAEARVLLDAALKVDSREGQAWLTLATLDMVQGDYAAAGKDCVQVSASAGFQWGLACSANLRAYTGNARQSLALLQQAGVGAAHMPAGQQAWLQGLMAESALRLGDWPLAETYYRAALGFAPQDNFLLVSYADFLLDRGRPAEVLPLLATHLQSDTAFLRIVLAEAALHAKQTQLDTWTMAARFQALKQRGSDFFGREQARFALELQHDPTSALDLARRNWQVQREPWDTRLLLEAALAADQPRAALEALEFIHKSKLEDPVLDPLIAELRLRLHAPPVAALPVEIK